MADGTTERVLRLLSLLQHRATWTGRELAAELGVTDRCVRRDVERLRTLGYPVRATQGVGGGYQLGAGTRLPPLLLDDDEAIATAVSLRLAAGGTVAGAGDAALRTLAKLDQLMPPRLRAEVRAVQAATATLTGGNVEVDAEVLMTLARACRDLVRVRFAYDAREGTRTERTTEPVGLVATGRHWYLMAWDVERDDWRTFRLDRMHDVVSSTLTFRPRKHPDPAEHVQRSVVAAPYRFVARVRLRAQAAEVRARMPPRIGRIEDDSDGWSVLSTGGDDLDWLALQVAALGYEAQVLEPPALRDAARALAERLDLLGKV
jgi:predicted DNA-binding transcriptional regulator YafY